MLVVSWSLVIFLDRFVFRIVQGNRQRVKDKSIIKEFLGKPLFFLQKSVAYSTYICLCLATNRCLQTYEQSLCKVYELNLSIFAFDILIIILETNLT